MIRRFLLELREQFLLAVSVVRTREFWIYLSVLLVLFLIGVAVAYMAMGFDPLTRGWLSMSFSCRTGEGQLATIIVGTIIFCLACMFTLGEVVYWVEETRQLRAPGRDPGEISIWRPLLFVAGTVILGATGYILMRTWCT